MRGNRRKPKRKIWSALTSRLQRLRLPFKEGAAEPEASELAFYEALQSMNEQAGAAVATEIVPASAAERSRAGRKRVSRQFIVVLLGVSVLGNLGAAVVGYKLYSMYKAEKSRVVVTQQPVQQQVAPPPETNVTPITQVVNWTAAQKTALAKDERVRIEGRLSAIITPDVFHSGALNFVYVPGLNHFNVQHDGGLSLSAFFHNGFLKEYLPTKMKVLSTYEGKVVLEKTIIQKYPVWLPGEVNLIELVFQADDIRDPDLINQLVKDHNLQSKLKFDVSMAYGRVGATAPEGGEEVWTYLNTQTMIDKNTR